MGGVQYAPRWLKSAQKDHRGAVHYQSEQSRSHQPWNYPWCICSLCLAQCRGAHTSPAACHRALRRGTARRRRTRSGGGGGGGEAWARRRAYTAALQPGVERELRGEQPQARLRTHAPAHRREEHPVIRDRGEPHGRVLVGPLCAPVCWGTRRRGQCANRSSCHHLAHD